MAGHSVTWRGYPSGPSKILLLPSCRRSCLCKPWKYFPQLQKELFVRAVSTRSIRLFLEWFTETQMFEIFMAEKLGGPTIIRGNSSIARISVITLIPIQFLVFCLAAVLQRNWFSSHRFIWRQNPWVQRRDDESITNYETEYERYGQKDAELLYWCW